MNKLTKRTNQKYQFRSGRLSIVLQTMNEFNLGFFRSYRDTVKIGKKYLGNCPPRASLTSLRMLYRTPKFFKGVFSMELGRIKNRFIKEQP